MILHYRLALKLKSEIVNSRSHYLLLKVDVSHEIMHKHYLGR